MQLSRPESTTNVLQLFLAQYLKGRKNTQMVGVFFFGKQKKDNKSNSIIKKYRCIEGILIF